MKYNIHRDGETQGPFTLAEIEAMQLPGDTNCAEEGAGEWSRLEEVMRQPVAHTHTEGAAVGALVAGLVTLVLGGLVAWGGMVLLISTVATGLGALALGIVGIVRVKNGEGASRGMAMAVLGVFFGATAMVLGCLVVPADIASQAAANNDDVAEARRTLEQVQEDLNRAREKLNLANERWENTLTSARERLELDHEKWENGLNSAKSELTIVEGRVKQAVWNLERAMEEARKNPSVIASIAGGYRVRANRIKCVNNVKQIGGALNTYADDNKNRYPWLLTWKDQVAEQGGVGSASTTTFYETNSLFAQAGVKAGFGGSQKILVSPCDPDRKEANAKVDLALAHHADNPIPNNAHSYGVVTGGGFVDGAPALASTPDDKGADVLKPTTVLTVTRNISDERLSDAPSGNPASGGIGRTSTWLGADQEPDNPRVMKRFFEGMGSLGRADGSGVQSDDDHLRRVAQDHINARGGNYKGIASSVLDTPND